jgi:hypothetical protein
VSARRRTTNGQETENDLAFTGPLLVSVESGRRRGPATLRAAPGRREGRRVG